MKLVYHSQRSIPRLAWCAVLRKGSPEVHVYHGTSVEVQEAFFVDGMVILHVDYSTNLLSF